MPDAQSVSVLKRSATIVPGLGARAVLSEAARTKVSPFVRQGARCAVAHVRRPLESAEIIAASGVSASSARRAIMAKIGQQFTPFVLSIRLDLDRAWLSINRESRSVTQIAAALGCRTPVMLSRSYGRRFGESVSETRWRATIES